MDQEEDETQVLNTSTASKTTTININHSYHLHSSDSPGMNIISSTFDGKGFPGWRRAVLIALSAKKKLGFINGGCKAPGLDTAEYEQWSCCNDMVISWLLNSLSREIGDSVIYSKTAKEIWDSLENRFGRCNGAKMYHLQKEVSSLVQGKGKLVKSLQDQKLMQFLMGLNDVYAQARGNFLMMSPLPSIDVAYSLLLQDENQREVYVNANPLTNSAAFMATTQGKWNHRNGNQMMRGNTQSHVELLELLNLGNFIC